jgi:ribosome-associated protein
LLNLHPVHIEGYRQADWVLLDYVDFVVHIFSEGARQYYDLERLWKSAKHLEVADLLAAPAKHLAKARKKAVKRPTRKPAAKKKRAPRKKP